MLGIFSYSKIRERWVLGANPDNAPHLEARGNGVFGFEDLPANLGISDNDFNDAVFQLAFTI